MIYIVDNNKQNNILENYLKENNKEYEYINFELDKIKELIESKNYEALFISKEFQSILNINYDYIYIKNDEIFYENLLEISFKAFLEKNEIDMNDKVMLLVGTSSDAKIIYEILKKKYKNLVIYISSIIEDAMKLYPNDRRIKKVEISNLKRVDFIINTTELGNIADKNSCILDGKNVIESNNVIDMVFNPERTSLILKYSLKGSKIYSGYEIEKLKYIKALEKI